MLLITLLLKENWHFSNQKREGPPWPPLTANYFSSVPYIIYEYTFWSLHTLNIPEKGEGGECKHIKLHVQTWNMCCKLSMIYLIKEKHFSGFFFI